MPSDSKILTSPVEYEDWLPDCTLAEYIVGHMEKHHGELVACIHAETKETLTYPQITQSVKDLATSLQRKFNLQPREKVAIALPSCLEYPIAFLSISLCGATAVLINPSQTISELKHSIKLTEPRLWIISDDFIPSFHKLYPIHLRRPPSIVLGNWSDVLQGGKGHPFQKPVINAKDDVALILFSSGTTGVPKGVALTHLNYMTSRRQNVELGKNVPRNPEDKGIVMLPLYHTFGMSSILDFYMRGMTFILLPRFSLRGLLKAVQEFRITIVSVVPAIATQLVKQPVEKHYDLSSIRMVFSGAAALSKEIAQQLSDKFGCLVFQAYGMTESTLRTHGNFLGYLKEGSIGVVMPFCECKVVHPETGEALGPNQEGEIWVRGPMIMKGYIGNEEATRSTLDKDGWLHTGDIGYYDEEEFFFITDRMKELIKYKGLQVSPTELEQVLLTHPDVMDVAVTSVPDEDAGELPRAYVVLKPSASVTENELAQFLADKVSSHKRLRGGLVFVDSIPKTPTGKILRRELKNVKPRLSSKL